MKKINTLCLLLAISGVANAGFTRLTAHSRANCVSINETISWDGMQRWNLYTTSFHANFSNPENRIEHGIESSPNPEYTYTKRSAALHVNEAYGNWEVWGVHWIYDEGEQKVFARTEAKDCNIYNGWWDEDYPERRS